MYPCSWVMYAVVQTGSMMVRFECGATRSTLPPCSAFASPMRPALQAKTTAAAIRIPHDCVLTVKRPPNAYANTVISRSKEHQWGSVAFLLRLPSGPCESCRDCLYGKTQGPESEQKFLLETLS